ncbi:uncharacterized protein LOC123448293 [Hordeum vulgare subsp. vulgare]|uniref:uncharacterized protein LOC123448293 n=1 Tax=Hordeum vulgare subsp. vulgare TaxID=112509 RepID=UPI001D1A3CA7|nr:uncharacterized protein LOC123448293 [Hordeum vulgare subsp. vulgare]
MSRSTTPREKIIHCMPTVSRHRRQSSHLPSPRLDPQPSSSRDRIHPARYNTLTEYLLQSAEEQNCSNQQQHNTATWISTRGASAARAHEQQQLVLQVQWKISKLISEK